MSTPTPTPSSNVVTPSNNPSPTSSLNASSSSPQLDEKHLALNETKEDNTASKLLVNDPALVVSSFDKDLLCYTCKRLPIAPKGLSFVLLAPICRK
jgi:hypothetical protein